MLMVCSLLFPTPAVIKYPTDSETPSPRCFYFSSPNFLVSRAPRLSFVRGVQWLAESRAMSLPTHLATQKPPNGGYPGHVAMADRELSASTRTDVDPLFEFFKQSTEDVRRALLL